MPVLRSVDSLKDQIKQQENRMFEINQQLRALAFEAIQRKETIKDLKYEIKQAKKALQREKWQKRFNTQQDIKEVLAKARSADIQPNEPWPRNSAGDIALGSKPCRVVKGNG